MATDTETLRLAMKVHRDLSQAIAPATPGTIEASHLDQKHVLFWIGLAGLVALLVLIVVKLATGFAPPQGGWRAGSEVVERVCGAMLGATLFAFWSARNYMRDGTFRKQYNQQYILRFVLGIFAGFILGELIGTYGTTGGEADGNGGAGGGIDLARYGALTIAVVGGFSAEAVVQILQRISDVLVATVRGSEWEQARTNAEAASRRRMNDAAAQVQEAMTIENEDERTEALRSVAAAMRRP